MNIEKWIIAHFSPTGGTKRVADAIAAGFAVPVAEMDLTKADSAVTLGEHDGLMAVLPVFAGRVPQISLERLSALKGSGQKAVAVVVYGNRELTMPCWKPEMRWRRTASGSSPPPHSLRSIPCTVPSPQAVPMPRTKPSAAGSPPM